MSPAAVYALLFAAIILEVIGTTALQLSQQLTRFWPSVLLVVCYAAAFYVLSLTLKVIPVGIAYAIWSAFGNSADFGRSGLSILSSASIFPP